MWRPEMRPRLPMPFATIEPATTKTCKLSIATPLRAAEVLGLVLRCAVTGYVLAALLEWLLQRVALWLGIGQYDSFSQNRNSTIPFFAKEHHRHFSYQTAMFAMTRRV